MDKYFSKGLFYDEIRKCIGIFAPLSVILIIKMIELFTSNSELFGDFFGFNHNIYFATCFMLSAITVNLYESYNPKECKYGFMLTQPYKRDAIVITKFLTTILSAILPLIIYGVIASFFYISNSYGVLLKELWGNILLSISIGFLVAAITQISNKLIGNTMIASFMPIGLAIIAPITLVGIFILTPLRFYRDNFTDIIIDSVSKILNLNIVLISVILITISLVIVCLSILLNRRITYEKTSDLFLFKFAELFFAYLGSLFISIWMVMISIFLVMKIFKFTVNYDRHNFGGLIILGIVIITLTILIKKLLYKFQRRMA